MMTNSRVCSQGRPSRPPWFRHGASCIVATLFWFGAVGSGKSDEEKHKEAVQAQLARIEAERIAKERHEAEEKLKAQEMERERQARLQEAQLVEARKQADRELATFASEQAPEVKATIEQLAAAIADREVKLAELERLLRARDRKPEKDKEVQRWRGQVTQLRKSRESMEVQLTELYIQHKKVVLAPDGEQAQRAKRQVSLANESAKASRRELDKMLKNSP
jgi:thioesterase domain-containing protein